jgi:hypothetical protein
MNIPLQPVKSSQIAAIGFDETSKTLAIQFKPNKWNPEKPGSIYHYSNFSVEDWNDFQFADSFGAHFQKFIKCRPDKYPYVKVS